MNFGCLFFGVGRNLGPQSDHQISTFRSSVREPFFVILGRFSSQKKHKPINVNAFTKPSFKTRHSIECAQPTNQQIKSRLRYRLHHSRHGWWMICCTSLLQIYVPSAGDITALRGRHMQNLHLLLCNSPPESL